MWQLKVKFGKETLKRLVICAKFYQYKLSPLKAAVHCLFKIMHYRSKFQLFLLLTAQVCDSTLILSLKIKMAMKINLQDYSPGMSECGSYCALNKKDVSAAIKKALEVARFRVSH